MKRLEFNVTSHGVAHKFFTDAVQLCCNSFIDLDDCYNFIYNLLHANSIPWLFMPPSIRP